MWIHVTKVDEKLYQDGKKVKEISVDGVIVDIVIKENGIWLNFV